MADWRRAEIATPRGIFSLVFHARGIFALHFPGCAPEQEYPRAELPWPGLAEELERYFRGARVEWGPYPLDDSGYPPFTRRLLREVRLIPYGASCSYREIAARAGSPGAWRAAGQALKANRHPLLVPCHRVVAAAGGPGGWSGPPGWKTMLLELEAGRALGPGSE